MALDRIPHGADEILLVNRNHARQRLGSFEIDGFERGPERRRPQHLAEQHAGTKDVRGVLMFSGDQVAGIHFRDGLAGPGSAGQ